MGIPKNFDKVRNIIAFNKIDKNIKKIYFDFDNFSGKEKNKMEDYDHKIDISKIEIKTSTLNINKINKANIINKNLYSNLKRLPQISNPNSSGKLDNNNNYGIKFEHNDNQLQQNNRYFNIYSNQNFNNNINELNNEQEE